MNFATFSELQNLLVKLIGNGLSFMRLFKNLQSVLCLQLICEFGIFFKKFSKFKILLITNQFQTILDTPKNPTSPRNTALNGKNTRNTIEKSRALLEPPH